MSFEVNRLSQDELIYELKYRGFTEEGNVDRMRKCLRNLLRHEKMERSFSYHASYDVPLEQEKQEIETKILEISNLVKDFQEYPETSLQKKLETKFVHIFGRVDRISVDTEQGTKTRADLLQRMLIIESDFVDNKLSEKLVSDKLSAAVNFEQGLSESVLNLNRNSVVEEEVLPIHSSSMIQPTDSTFKMKVVPVSKWNLQFSGDKGLSIGAFLERVDELCAARNFPKDRLLDSAIDLFKGRALVWFRSVRGNVASWSDLVRKLKEEFQPPDYDFLLWEEIKGRTQGRDETIGIYVATMENLFKRLNNPISESAKLGIIIRNLNPFYNEKLGLTEIESTEKLIQLGHSLEARRSMIESYQPPSRKKADLEPDLAYIETKVASCSTVNNITCWNCRQIGHVASKCPDKKHKRCFKCRKEGFTVRTCPDCNKTSVN